MALRLLEGFEMYGDSGRTGSGLDVDIERRHEGGAIIYGSPDGDLITGRGGHGLALRFGEYDTNNKIWFSRYDHTQSDTWIMGFAIKTGEMLDHVSYRLWESYYYSPVLYVFKGGLGMYCSQWDAPEYIPYRLQANRWYYFEIKVYHHNTAGTIEMRINGETVYSVTGKDTIYSSYDGGSAYCLYSVEDLTAYDDIYICDGSGTDNNDFLGPIKVETLRPDGDDGTQNWSPSSGSNHYELVNSSNLWQLTDYVEANGANVDDLWTFDNLSKITGNIYAAQVVVSAWTDVPSPQPLQVFCDSNSTLEYSETRGIGARVNFPLPHELMLETDPDTANAWTANGLHAASFGIRKV